MPTPKVQRFATVLILTLPALGSCGYPNTVLPAVASLTFVYAPGGACPGAAILNHSAEVVLLDAHATGGSSTQTLTVAVQPGGSELLAPAFTDPYTAHSLSSKGNTANSGNVSYSLGFRCSATSAEVTKVFTLLGDTMNTLTLTEDAGAPGGLTVTLKP